MHPLRRDCTLLHSPIEFDHLFLLCVVSASRSRRSLRDSAFEATNSYRTPFEFHRLLAFSSSNRMHSYLKTHPIYVELHSIILLISSLTQSHGNADSNLNSLTCPCTQSELLFSSLLSSFLQSLLLLLLLQVLLLQLECLFVIAFRFPLLHLNRYSFQLLCLRQMSRDSIEF